MSIERLPERKISHITEESVYRDRARTKKFVKGFINHAGILVGVLITFVVVLTTMTNSHLVSLEDVSSLSIGFFLLLSGTYSVYISCSDSGMRAGLATTGYTESCDLYEKRKRALIEKGYQTELYSFCRSFVEKELRNARMNIITLVGFTYEEYLEKWSSADKECILSSTDLTNSQKKALLKANKLSPITLTPEMFMRKGRLEGKRVPLGADPVRKKKIHFGVKLSSMIAFSSLITMVAFDVLIEPSWAMFASVFLKLIAIVYNGFKGYKFGYENIVIDTVNYISDQTDLLEEAIEYIEKMDVKDEVAPNT